MTEEQFYFSPWSWTGDGRRIYHSGHDADIVLTVDGHFENDDQRFHFCRDVVRKLDTTPPQRKPLTEDEIADAANSCRWSETYHITFARAIERAHGIGINHD
jgi:hypothetical protein